jgi:hypothetical protein
MLHRTKHILTSHICKYGKAMQLCGDNATQYRAIQANYLIGDGALQFSGNII